MKKTYVSYKVIVNKTCDYFENRNILLNELKPADIHKFYTYLYSQIELNTLFSLIKEDPLKIVIYLASFYGFKKFWSDKLDQLNELIAFTLDTCLTHFTGLTLNR